MERSGVEHRDERWVRRPRERSEELLVEAAQEVDRLRLRNPERPRVPRVQPSETRRPEEPFDEKTRRRDPDRGDDQAVSGIKGAASRTTSSPPSGRQRRTGDDHGRHPNHDPERERDSSDQQKRPERAYGDDAEYVGESAEASELNPGVPAPNGPEKPGSAREEEEVERDETSERVSVQRLILAIVMPSALSQTTSAREPYCSRSQP